MRVAQIGKHDTILTVLTAFSWLADEKSFAYMFSKHSATNEKAFFMPDSIKKPPLTLAR